jgi:hypothetical protein
MCPPTPPAVADNRSRWAELTFQVQALEPFKKTRPPLWPRKSKKREHAGESKKQAPEPANLRSCIHHHHHKDLWLSAY